MEKEGLMVLEEDQKVILFSRIISDACGQYFDGSLDQDVLLSPMFFFPVAREKSSGSKFHRGVAAVHGFRCSCRD